MNSDLPQNPLILASYINTMLRDRFGSLDELCASLDIERDWLVKKLRLVGMTYDATVNRFW
jgi:hypothetical protein